MSEKSIVLGVLAAGLAVVLAAPARAQTYDKLTYLTFSGSVQIPGVTLTAGTYRFRLTDTETRRKVVQVLSHDGSAVYSMFHTIPAYRAFTTDEPVVTFRETPAGVAPAIRSLFYEGESLGYEFVWWKPIDMTVAAAPQPPITYTPMAVVPIEAEAVVFEPAPIEAELESVVVEPAVAELPKTASPFPLVALLGFSATAAGLGVRSVRRRLS